MTGKPAPTPWRYKPFTSHDPDISTLSGWANIWGAKEQRALASVGGGVGAMGNFEANAALIVRAVNAHEALVEALEDMVEEWACSDDDCPHGCKEARAALALALAGETP